MRYLIIFSVVFLMSVPVQAQFWFGPKVGAQITQGKYQNKKYKANYSLPMDVNWHAGFALQYTTEQRFAVHTELIYQKVTNSITNKSGDIELDYTTRMNFIGTAMHGRMTFGSRAFQFYLIGGPRLTYWLSGDGEWYSEEAFLDFGNTGESFSIEFSEQPVVNEGGKIHLPRPNRLQYGLDIGFGGILDLASGQRIVAEVRYSIGHSNMAFNNDDIVLFGGLDFQPNYEFANDMAIFSLSYLFGYNPNDRRKGSSTNKLSNTK